MKKQLKPGAGILFMKVGTHAREPLEDIIARKTREIVETGYAMWGYGGGTCHPSTMVQPFAEGFARAGNVIYLVMQEMESKHFAEQIRADQFSVDGASWEDIPETINVLGSRYALLVKNLRKERFDLPLGRTRVGVGNSIGLQGSRYVQGRVDKACLEVTEDMSKPMQAEEAIVPIGLVAELVKPYAVFLRNRS
jgi:hypothetical protein